MKNIFKGYYEWIFIVVILCITAFCICGCKEIERNPQLIEDSEKLVDEIIDDTIKEHQHRKPLHL